MVRNYMKGYRGDSVGHSLSARGITHAKGRSSPAMYSSSQVLAEAQRRKQEVESELVGPTEQEFTRYEAPVSAESAVSITKPIVAEEPEEPVRSLPPESDSLLNMVKVQ